MRLHSLVLELRAGTALLLPDGREVLLVLPAIFQRDHLTLLTGSQRIKPGLGEPEARKLLNSYCTKLWGHQVCFSGRAIHTTK